jgi:hypothetical protein
MQLAAASASPIDRFNEAKRTRPAVRESARDLAGSRLLIGKSMPPNRHFRAGRRPRAGGLRSVTVLVPESCAEGLRDLARVLRTRQRERTTEPPFGWRKISPSAELMVDPERGARCAIRDTGAAGPERYHWTVTVFGETEPVAAGRAGELGEARSQVEAALAATAR